MSANASWHVKVDVDLDLGLDVVKIGRDAWGKYVELRTNEQTFRLRQGEEVIITAPYRHEGSPVAATTRR